MNELTRNTGERTNQIQTTIGYQRLQPIKIEALLYADDIVLIADSVTKMQKLINIWTEEIEKLKMEINIEKSKIMLIGEKEENEVNIKCKNTQLEIVTAYDYLGSIITNDGKIDLEITDRTKKSNKL